MSEAVVQNRINNILKERETFRNKVNELVQEWNQKFDDIDDRIEQAKRAIKKCDELKDKECDEQDHTTLEKLRNQLEEISKELEKRKEQKREIERHLGDLQKRFVRENKTIIIAAIGLARCGKSTVLKSLLGLKLEDNTVIPARTGNATTFCRSFIEAVDSEEKQKTIVKYHSKESLLNEVINPLLASFGRDKCGDWNDFEQKYTEAIKREDDNSKESKKNKVRRLEGSDFDMLNNLIEHRNDYKECLGKKDEEIEEIGDTYKYVSYPEGEEGHSGVQKWTYLAVRNCHIYLKFNNSSIEKVCLIDLPGLGTDASIEERHFEEGLDCSVDFACIVRRPEATEQAYRTAQDKVIEKHLKRVFHENWEASSILFQNDGNVGAGCDPDKTAREIEKRWKKDGTNRVLLRGDANNPEEAQKLFNEKIMDIVSKKLPDLDRKFFDRVKDEISKLGQDWSNTLEETKNKVNQLTNLDNERNLAAFDDDFEEELLPDLFNKLMDLKETYMESGSDSEDVEQSVLNKDIIEKGINPLTEKLIEKFKEEYQPDNTESNKFKKLIHTFRRAGKKGDAAAFIREEYELICSSIRGKYMELESARHDGPSYDAIVNEVQSKVADCIIEGLKMRADVLDDSDQPRLEKIKKLAEDCPNSGRFVEALSVMRSFRIPFLTSICPVLNENLFNEAMYNKQIRNTASWEEENAKQIIDKLRSRALSWAREARILVIRCNSDISRIIVSYLTYFIDQVCRNKDGEGDLKNFVYKYTRSKQRIDFNKEFGSVLERLRR